MVIALQIKAYSLFTHVALILEKQTVWGWGDGSATKVPSVEVEGLCLDPQHPCEKLAMVAHTCNHSTVRVASGEPLLAR